MISISPCPKGGERLDSSIKKIRSDKPSLVVSLLTFPESLGLELSMEANVCESHSIQFINFPIMDKGICGFDQFVEFIELLYSKTYELNSILIHCQHGVGRSGMIALGLMLREGKDIEESIKRVSEIRGYDVPQSLSQRKLLSLYHKNINSL